MKSSTSMCLRHNEFNEISLARTLGTKTAEKKALKDNAQTLPKCIKMEITDERRACSLKSSSLIVKVEIYFQCDEVFMVRLVHNGGGLECGT